MRLPPPRSYAALGHVLAQTPLERKEYTRHVRLEAPLTVKMDGRTGCGVILKP